MKEGSPFWTALAATAIPIIAVSIFSTTGNPSRATGSENIGVWFIAAGLWVIAGIAGIVFSKKGKGQIAKGIGLGLIIALVSLGGSCVVNVANFPI